MLALHPEKSKFIKIYGQQFRSNYKHVDILHTLIMMMTPKLPTYQFHYLVKKISDVPAV